MPIGAMRWTIPAGSQHRDAVGRRRRRRMVSQRGRRRLSRPHAGGSCAPIWRRIGRAPPRDAPAPAHQPRRAEGRRSRRSRRGSTKTCSAFGRSRPGASRGHISRHLTDGYVDLALMLYDSEDDPEAKLVGPGPAIHHFGVAVADVRTVLDLIRANGGEIRPTLIAARSSSASPTARSPRSLDHRPLREDEGTAGLRRASSTLNSYQASHARRVPKSGQLRQASGQPPAQCAAGFAVPLGGAAASGCAISPCGNGTSSR